MIVREHALIFIHIPKCAGTSVEYFFLETDQLLWKHITARQAIVEYGQEVWEACFKFTIVRNPWTRVVSMFRMLARDKPGLEWEPWLRQVCGQGMTFGGVKLQQPMTDYVCNERGEVLVDFVARYETLRADFSRVLAILGLEDAPLPHRFDGLAAERWNQDKTQAPSGRAPSYPHSLEEWYPPPLRELVGNLFRSDVETFEYSFER